MGKIFSGRKVEQAIADGLDQLKLTREQVEIEILDEGSRGVFGVGAKPARVRLTPVTLAEPEPTRAEPEPVAVEQAFVADADTAPGFRDPEAAQLSQNVLTKILELMGFDVELRAHQAQPASDEEEGPLVLDVYGSEVDALIGRKGETLASLQRIVRLIVGRRLARRANLVVDIAGYKQQREEKLQGLAKRMAKQAVGSGRTVTLEPMPAYERRLVHLALRDSTEVSTESVGSGNRRRVTIIPNQS